MEEPRLPEVRQMGGNVPGETPQCFAKRARSRGFGWCVAKLPTDLREMPLRASTAAMTFSMRVIAARERASPSNFTSRDRKSTRLNSSHGYISYAVFCLKKKKKNLDIISVVNESTSIVVH